MRVPSIVYLTCELRAILRFGSRRSFACQNSPDNYRSQNYIRIYAVANPYRLTCIGSISQRFLCPKWVLFRLARPCVLHLKNGKKAKNEETVILRSYSSIVRRADQNNFTIFILSEARTESFDEKRSGCLSASVPS